VRVLYDGEVRQKGLVRLHEKMLQIDSVDHETEMPYRQMPRHSTRER